jgi:hypothetical protein
MSEYVGRAHLLQWSLGFLGRLAFRIGNLFDAIATAVLDEGIGRLPWHAKVSLLDLGARDVNSRMQQKHIRVDLSLPRLSVLGCRQGARSGCECT